MNPYLPFITWIIGMLVGGALGFLFGYQRAELKTHLRYNQMLKNALKQETR